MKNTTLCYIENERGEYLMLHRVKKQNDLNHDKWIGVGGHLEPGETPEVCVLREALEETGLTLTDYRYRGLVTFVNTEWPTEYMHLFTSDAFEGTLAGPCVEGELAWVEKSAVPGLPLWEGDRIFLRVPSVGATENLMMAASLAEGTTTIENAAKEPHIVDLANFLNSMGADIKGAGTDTIRIFGVDKLHGGTYAIIPDQIEAGSYMVAAAITKGDITLHNVIPKHMEPITAKLRAAGCEVEEFDDALRITRTGELKPLKLKTMPHPGFPTDMQPLMTALLTLAKGTSIVTEGIWENRFRYVDELIHMGANIQVDGQVAVIEGVKELHPAPLRATDLRAGAAMVMAALAANGVSEVDETIHIERGYENIVEKLRGLGADISKVDRVPAALEQAWMWTEAQFEEYLREYPPTEDQRAVMREIEEKCGLAPMEEPWRYLKKVRAETDCSGLRFEKEYEELLHPVRPPADGSLERF